MKELLLHIGFHKTATTSIQETCKENIDSLKAQGLFYPIFCIDDRKLSNHSVPMFSMFCPFPSAYHMNIRWGYSDRIEKVNSIYMEQLNSFFSQNDKILISGEDISLLPENSIANLLNFFEQRGFNVKAFCSVRRPYSFFCSSHQTNIRFGTESFKVPTKSDDVVKLRNVFGEKIHFFSFEEDCKHPLGPVGAFLERVGINCEQLNIVNDANKGIGNLTTRLYAHLNKEFPIFKDGQLNPKGRSQKIWNFDEDKFLLTEEELTIVIKDLDKENSKLSFILGDVFSDKNYRTSKPFRIKKDLALEIYEKAAKPEYVSKSVLKFIHSHCDFPLYELAESLSTNASLLRDIALLTEESDLPRSYELMKQAHNIRPSGPFISKKLVEYRKKLNHINSQSYNQ